MFKKQQGIEYIDLKSKSGQQRKFFKVKYLGSGGFARCYQIYEQTHTIRQHYAFKIIKKSTLYQTKQLIDRLRTEIKLHKKFSQPKETANQHIVRFIESFQTQDYIYLLLELCVNQTLNELIRRRKFLTQEETRFYIWQLAHGLKEIHSRNVVHRDIKLCNLFLAQGLKIKIGDFGLATEIHEQRKRYTICGTANYIAPQMIQKDHNGGPFGHGYEVDVWALGVVCYTIFFGKYPFEAQQEQSIYNKVLSCKYSFNPYSMKEIKQLNINALNHFPSNEFKSFIKGIFEINPSKRFTLDDVLSHEFLNKTTVPKELPQISLKCALKKDTIEKMFTKKENTRQSQSQATKNDQTKQKKQNQPIDPIKNDNGQKSFQTLPNSTTEFCHDQSNSQKQQNQFYQDICMKKTESYQTQEDKTQMLQQISCESIVKQLSPIELTRTSKNQAIFIKFQRKGIPLDELTFDNCPKTTTGILLLQIILSRSPMQTSCLKELTFDGMIIRVFNLRDNQIQKIDNSHSQYTLLIHPKLNYLMKVIEAPKSKVIARTPLGEVPEDPKNNEGLNSKEKGSKNSLVAKIPLKKSSHKELDKDENNTSKKYWEQLNIVKTALNYLSKMVQKRAQQGMNLEEANYVVAN